MNNLNSARKRGFTLIELLVVIAIIAILAAILFPVFAQAREKARQITCASNLKQLGIACLSYTEDYDEQLPSSWSGPNGYGASNPATGVYKWMDAVYPYVKSVGVYHCPDDAGQNGSTGNYVFYQNLTGANANYYGSYGMNAWAMNPPDSSIGVYMSSPASDYWRKITPVGGNVTQIPVFADAVYDGSPPLDHDTPVTHQGWFISSGTGSGMSNFSIPRHSGRVPLDICFADSSARTVGIKELWTLPWSRSFNTTYMSSLNSWPAWMNSYQ